MKIAIVGSEAAPYAKTGGLADVVGSLPAALKALGHEVIVIIPKYASIDTWKTPMQRFFPEMCVWMGNTEEWCAVDVFRDAGGIDTYFIESDKYFNRPGIYHDAHYTDYSDNPRRFAFFTRAALQLCIDMQFSADVFHFHDWQTSLGPGFLKIWHWDNPIIGGAGSILTIHNLNYQGRYAAEHYDYTGLQWQNFTPDKFEDHGSINFLKGGIYYADIVNTVSPTYAHEIASPSHSGGLTGSLLSKGDRFLGILNGVDYSIWNPETDPLIPAHFSQDNLSGKAICKTVLQQSMGLYPDPGVPLIGVVSRFADQKGLDLLAQAMEGILGNMHVQFVILGSGDPDLERFFGSLPARYPGRVGSYIGFSNELSHLVEAGSDFFLMPSRYEPCGLNQIYSLRYGTLPIVRATGGLSDTVYQYDEHTGGGTGFLFREMSGSAIYYTVGWAVSTYYDRKHHMADMIHRAMGMNFSWEASAREYVRAYQVAHSA